jgi:hypothetical protein
MGSEMSLLPLRGGTLSGMYVYVCIFEIDMRQTNFLNTSINQSTRTA